MSEWVGGHRQFVSGFIESAGLALITKNEARLWTDSRYFLQDTHQLNDQQQLMRMEEDPAVDIWMADQLSHPREVLDRCTFFRLIYTKKGPIPKPINDEAAKEFDELEKLEQRERDAGREVTADVRNKLYVERFGPEKRNRVRGYGAGVQWRHVPGILTKKQGISSEVQSLRTQCEEQRVAAEQARIVAEHASAEVERMKKEITMKDQEMQNREKRFEEKFKELEARLNERNANPFAVL